MAIEPQVLNHPQDDGEGAALAFDPAALKAKYREERDKRLRADANEQYVEMSGRYAHYLEDPYIAAPIERAALSDEREVVVIGGGFGGLLAGARLREAGIEDLRIIEKGGEFGGTWYWNRYPGAACDIESYVYLPLLEETGFMPERKYSQGPEIRAHSRRIAEHYDLYRDVLFQTEVTDLTWDEAATRWIVSTNRGDRIRARFVVMANGPLHRPKLPGIPGIEDFEGHTFHTSRWDYDYTGGDQNGGLDRLGDKVVGVIGTGATAVQAVPHLGAAAKRLYVFQRTPSSIDVRGDRLTDESWARSLTPGWHQHRMENFNTLVSGGWAEEDLVQDGWTDIIRNLGMIARIKATRAAREDATIDPDELVQLADFQKMESIRARVDAVVEDEATAAALKPYYNQFCKRPCFHDDYLATFNRPNVTLVDTQGQGVERITRDGVVVAGREYKLDCLIFATGFEVGTSYARRAGYQIHGVGGRTLEDKWATGGASLHGMTVNGFPNCFIFSHVQAGFTANYPHALAEQAVHAAHIIRHAIDTQRQRVEPTEEAEAAWTQEILATVLDRRKFLEECTPGYYNGEGKTNPLLASFSSYGKGPVAFFQLLADWRASGTHDGLAFAPASHEAAGAAQA
jgi:cyclohexanone monooxygenase